MLATVVGLAVWIGAELIDAPSPGLFGLAGAAASVDPVRGHLRRMVAGDRGRARRRPVWEVVLIVVVASVMQYLEATRWRPLIDRRSLYVGPAVLVIAAALGFTIYGFGGLVVLAVSAVFALAIADQVATDDPDDPVDGDDALEAIPTPTDEYVEPTDEPESELPTPTPTAESGVDTAASEPRPG